MKMNHQRSENIAVVSRGFQEEPLRMKVPRNFHKMHLQGNLFNLMRYLVSQVLEFIAIYTAEYQDYVLKSILCSKRD